MTMNRPSSGETAPPIYNGRYELRNQIARGGTAQVYLARDLLLDRPVALKVLFPELSSDNSFVERFRREAQAAANLSHPNIVPVFDWGESERTYFIVMEHIDGEPLSNIIRAQAPLPPLRAAAIAADIAKALSYAHRHGVVHRDVKPGNVLITRDGLVKVADFGIARAIGSDDNVTQTGLVMGTATYFSPEQAQGLGVDGRSDVYSLGVVLYEMVTGRPPFVADTPVAIAYKHVSENAVPPRAVEPLLPAPLEAIIMRAMAKNPAERYATAEDMQADLQRFMQGAAVVAPPIADGGATAAMAVGDTVALQSLAAGVAGVALGGAAGAAAGGGGVATTGQQALENGRGPGGGPPSTPAMPKHRWIPWAIVGVLLAAALVPLVVYGARQLGYLGGKGYVYVPAGLEGRSLASAEQILRANGLVPSPVAKVSNVHEGTVLSTKPAKGTQIQEGEHVTVVYSSGPAKIPVPEVVNGPYTKAIAILRSHKLNPQLVPVTPHPGDVIGTVTRTDPSPNTPVLPGTTVKVYYYSGTPVTTVPNVHGETVANAENKLRNAFLAVGSTVQQLSGTVAKGLVISTNPSAGTTQPENTPVTLIVSEGQGVRLPSFVGQNYNSAEAAITNLGLVPQVSFQPSPASKKNIVLQQTPNGPVQVGPGSTVTLIVGQGTIVTVTNPGTQASKTGSTVSLQIQATDSASGATLTYTATGLPPGLSINSASGLITGTPSAPGQYSVTVTVTDPSNSTANVTFNWKVTP